ncbi:MAG: YCF48-related protein [Ignavibacteria bacterium]|nr:YCF48-related protein [Ignavibacteria bacterium]
MNKVNSDINTGSGEDSLLLSKNEIFAVRKIKRLFYSSLVFILPVIVSFTLGHCEGIGVYFSLHCDPFSHQSISDYSSPFGVTSNGEIWRTLPSCELTLEYEVPLNYSLNSIVLGFEHIVVGNSGTIVRKENINANWELRDSPTAETLWDVCYNKLNEYYYAVGNNGTIIKSTDDGISWFQLPAFTTENLYVVECFITLDLIFVFGANVTGFKSTDGGNTWNEMDLYGGLNNSLQSGGPDIYTSFFLNPDTGYVFGEFGTIFYTSDGGNLWQPGVVPDFVRINTAYFISPDSGMVAGDNGKVRFTINGGATWVEDTSVTNLTSNNINQISIIDNSIAVIIGDSGTVIFAARDSSVLTSVENIDEIVTEYHLYQNYPNPFNPSTKIRFRIVERGYVNLIVFDLLGNEITTLVNEEKQTGEYEVEFNASNLPSGIYFYRLKSGGFSTTKKLVLIK